MLRLGIVCVFSIVQGFYSAKNTALYGYSFVDICIHSFNMQLLMQHVMFWPKYR